jgi:outer membrane protein assembly factor BamD (BamD/ComL family)
VEVCPATGGWAAGDHGYRQYLALWPGGPDADEAWWMAELRNGPRCAAPPGDAPASAEEYRRLIDEYRRFVERFPRSRYSGEASARVRRYERELARIRP